MFKAVAQDLTDLLADAVKSMREAGDVEEAEVGEIRHSPVEVGC